MKNIALFGLGCIGQGLYDLLKKSGTTEFRIKRIAVKDRQKARKVSNQLLVFDKHEIFNDQDIDLIVEAIDDADEAFLIAKYALLNKIPLISANKKMIAEHLTELIELQEITSTPFLYEAAVCGSIPIIKILEDQFSSEPITKISGIFNGTSNYILTKIFNENLDYHTALKQAQELGFAESNPTNDVEGFDAKYKALILAQHAFGVVFEPNEILTIGINNISEFDIEFARSKNLKIKLTPQIFTSSQSVGTIVVPSFISSDQPCFHVENETNIVELSTQNIGNQQYIGNGAGAFPTSFSILNDIKSILKKFKYTYPKQASHFSKAHPKDIQLELYIRTQESKAISWINPSNIIEKLAQGENTSVVVHLTLFELLEKYDLLKTYESAIISTKTPYITENKYFSRSRTKAVKCNI